jgi:RHS repeat-associated protein
LRRADCGGHHGSGGRAGDLRYGGLFYHAQSGLYLATYRAYDPSLGRWLARDPIAENGGINLYEYVGGNPLTGIDPRGLTLETGTPGGPSAGVPSPASPATPDTPPCPPGGGPGDNGQGQAGGSQGQADGSADAGSSADGSTPAPYQEAQATFGHGSRHVPAEIAPGLEDAISGALPPSVPMGVFGKGAIFYDGAPYEFHYYGLGTGVHVGTYYPLD